MTQSALGQSVNTFWHQQIIESLSSYVEIPALSVAFDHDWAANGHLDAALEHMRRWVASIGIDGVTIERVEAAGYPAVLWIEIEGSGAGEVLCYGHYDKQPENDGWSNGFAPWKPVLKDERLYGRGAADDGYALYSYIAAVQALQQNGVPHGRVSILLEGAEESGSPGLAKYLDILAPKIGTPDLIVVLDSGCADYERVWCTTSLRGMIGGVLSVGVLEQGVHSGGASGIVPSSFRIVRQLLDRIENVHSGAIIGDTFEVDIPATRKTQVSKAVALLGARDTAFPFDGETQAVSSDPVEQELNRTWRAVLSVTGADGLPPSDKAGNVLRTHTALKLSLRLPPTANAKNALDALREILVTDPPYNASVAFTPREAGQGWNAPDEAPWLIDALNEVSQERFDNEAMFIGEGGSIPLMAMLQERFPAAQFLVTGVLGPHSNAHGPNEFLDLPMARAATHCVAVAIRNLARG